MYCSEAHRKRFKRLSPEERSYPRLLEPGLREQRCHAHGELFLEMWVQSLTVWTGACRKCAEDVGIWERVDKLMRADDMRRELARRIDAEMIARAGDLTRDIEQRIEQEIPRLRASFTHQLTNTLRGAIRSDIELEMREEIAAELKGEMVTA